MPITFHNIANVGSPPDDPLLLLPGTLYIPDPAVHPQPWPCVAGTVANTFHSDGGLVGLTQPFTDLANAGFLCLAQKVRLLNPQPGQTTSGKWPQQPHDLQIGIAKMRSNPFSLGYSVTGFVGTLGYSGGGHNALVPGLEGTVGGTKSDGVITMSPPTDFSDRVLPQETPDLIAIWEAYTGVTDLPTMLARSPISLDLANANPILQYNGDNETMPQNMLFLFRDAMIAAGAVDYEWHLNTGVLGTRHALGMWTDVSAHAVAWMLNVVANWRVQIVVQPSNQDVVEGDTATFDVVANGAHPISYQWRKNGANILGATSDSYTTPITTLLDDGEIFAVVASNIGGSATSVNALLTVHPPPGTPPEITSQPGNTTVLSGQSAFFSVTATGTLPLEYQWRKNGVNILGANSASYTTPPVTFADSGTMYSVVITNLAGSVTSDNATVFVATGDPARHQPSPRPRPVSSGPRPGPSPITPPPDKPDLVVSNLVAIGTNTEGEIMNFRANIFNQGLVKAASSFTRFKIDGVAEFDDISTKSLKAGHGVQIDSPDWIATEGVHAIAAVADATGIVLEGDELNNTLTIGITILPIPEPDVHPYVKGIWCSMGKNDAVDPGLQANAGIVGLTIPVDWDEIELTDGVYTWTVLDNRIALAIAAGFTNLNLAIIWSQENTPRWLIDQLKALPDVPGGNGETLPMLDTSEAHATFCRIIDTPIWWSTLWHGKRLALIAAAGARYANHLNVDGVFCSFLNHNTLDWGTPDAIETVHCGTHGIGGDVDVNQVQQWLDVGFTRDIVFQVGKEIIDAVAAAFPKQNLKLPIGRMDITLSATSPDTGYGQVDTTLAQEVEAYCNGRSYVDRFFIQRNTVSARWGTAQALLPPNPPPNPRKENYVKYMIALACLNSGRGGLQTLDQASVCVAGGTCRQNGDGIVVSPEQVMQDTLNSMLTYGCTFNEVWTADAKNASFYDMMVAATLAMGGTPRF